MLGEISNAGDACVRHLAMSIGTFALRRQHHLVVFNAIVYDSFASLAHFGSEDRDKGSGTHSSTRIAETEKSVEH